MTGQEIKAIFEPVMDKVLQLVNGQIQATQNAVKAVILVGGFGQNAYLRERINEAIGDIEVLQPPHGSVSSMF